MRFYHAVSCQAKQVRQESREALMAFDKFDADGKVLPRYSFAPLGMDTLMRPKAGVRANQAGAGNTLFQQKFEDLAIKKIAARTGVLI